MIFRKSLLTLALAGLMLGAPAAALADTTVTVTVPEFPVVLNGLPVEQANSQYPSILYENITYVPMTYHDAKLLGLDPYWSQETGFRLNKADFVPDMATAQAAYQPYITDAVNGKTYEAVRPSFAITVNGKIINNDEEPYPLLVFRDVTYFPLTWRFAVDEFGWKYKFDFESGLVITPEPTPVAIELDSSFGGEQNIIGQVTITGDGVNLRSGAGTKFDKVGVANQGETLALLGEGKDETGKLWYRIKTKTGATAWIASWYCKKDTGASNTVTGGNATIGNTGNTGNTGSVAGSATISPAPSVPSLNTLPAANVGKTIYVTGDGVNLRSGAGTGFSSVGQVKKGESFTALAVKNDSSEKAWYQVGIGDGETAWIASWYTSTVKSTADNTSSSTGELTFISGISVAEDNRKITFRIKNGAGNTYKMESVTDNSAQWVLDNVQVNGQLLQNWGDFMILLSDIGDNKARLNLVYPPNCYVNLEQKEETLYVNCYRTGNGLYGRVIVLDPGHGGADVGAQGYSNKNLTDADVGYTVSLKLKAMLENAGATVFLTRGEIPKNTKVVLAERMELSNGIEPDIFVSIHANSTANGTTAVYGAQVYTYNNPLYPQKPLADTLANAVNEGLKQMTQRPSVLKSDSLYVLRMNNHPSILVETAFLNNLEDEALLATDEYRQLLAEGIYQGIQEYFSRM